MTGEYAWPLQLRWDDTSPLTEQWVTPNPLRGSRPRSRGNAFSFTAHMRALCEDVSARCETLRHIQMSRVLVSFTPSRNRSRYGLQARVTPLRFHNGTLIRKHGSTNYQVQRFFVNDCEMLYVLTFCLPRFLDQSFREKLVTVFHELYHMAPAFDGDLRRHPGRYAVHSHSKDGYDSRMEELVDDYLAEHPEPAVFRFLQFKHRELCETHGGVTGVIVPRPRLLPVGSATTVAARKRN